MTPGRALPPTSPFAADDGSCAPELLAALDVDGAAARLSAVVLALASTRVLVPVVAHEEHDHHGAGPHAHVQRDLGVRAGDPEAPWAQERAASAALVTVAGPDGRAVLPVFSSVETLQRWDPKARLLPSEGPRAALAASTEADGLLVLDPAGPVTVLVPRPAVWALAQGRRWVPSPQDPEVAAAVATALRDVAGLVAVRCERGRKAELAVVLSVVAGLDQAALDGVVAQAGRALAAVEIVAERVDSLELRLVSAESVGGQPEPRPAP